MKGNFKWTMLFMALTVIILGACSNSAKDEYPNKNIEIIAPATPGGGWDATARAIQNVLDKEGIVEQNMNVVNKPGGGGEVGWQYLKNKDAHHLSVNSSLVIANNLLGQSELTYEDFTPLAILATEWISVAVPENSDIKDGVDLLEKLKKDPASLTIAVGPALGNNDHLSFIHVAEEYGIDVSKLRFMVYESGGDVLTALLGGHVDLATFSLSEAQEQHEAGNIRVIATTADETIDGIPSWQDQGIDFTFPHWRGLMGPPNMTEEEIAYWDNALKTMVESDGWKTVLENNGWDDYYMDSKETKKFLDEKNEMYKELIEKAGLGK